MTEATQDPIETAALTPPPAPKVLYAQDGSAIRLTLADGSTKLVQLRHRVDLRGMEPVAHTQTMLSAGLAEALERLAGLEEATRKLVQALEAITALEGERQRKARRRWGLF